MTLKPWVEASCRLFRVSVSRSHRCLWLANPTEHRRHECTIHLFGHKARSRYQHLPTRLMSARETGTGSPALNRSRSAADKTFRELMLRTSSNGIRTNALNFLLEHDFQRNKIVLHLDDFTPAQTRFSACPGPGSQAGSVARELA